MWFLPGKDKKLMRGIVLLLMLLASPVLYAESIQYGNNPQAGHYHNVGDAKIYYETYGTGAPLLLLHGGLFGSIAEFEKFIPKLSNHFRVIAISTRGHDKSEIGTKPFSYKQFADDAIDIIHQTSKQPVVILGFSDGAITAYNIAAQKPELVSKMVVIGGGLSTSDYQPEGLKWVHDFDGLKLSPKFIADKKANMPEPDRWLEFTSQLKQAWLQKSFVAESKVSNILTPTLIIGGDKDDFMHINSFIRQKTLLKNSQLLILPNTGHVGSLQSDVSFSQYVMPFLLQPAKL